MQKFNMLVLTDHIGHSAENSIYALVKSMQKHPRCARIDVATRGNPMNASFFRKLTGKRLFVAGVDDDFAFHPQGDPYTKNLRREDLRNYDVVWLRMPPPLADDFLDFLIREFPDLLFINDPRGIKEAGSKKFLLNFPAFCPPMKVCTSVDDVVRFGSRFPIVLKPLREYGGKGIVKIDGNRVWEGAVETTLPEFLKKIRNGKLEYLGVEFLKNVTQGDKRIIVVRGHILGASLRLPPPDSWICNVAMGGHSYFAEADEEEKKIVAHIDPVLSQMGVVMYGLDTLVDDEGKRVLSEINVASIGGVPQIGELSGRPVVWQVTDLLSEYIIKRTMKKNVVPDR